MFKALPCSYLDPEFRAPTGVAHGNIALHTFFDDRFGNEKSDPRTFVCIFCREIWLEDTVNHRIRDTAGIVRYGCHMPMALPEEIDFYAW